MQVGKKVVCVDDAFPEIIRRLYTELPRKNAVYTVREVSLGREKLAVIKDGKIVPHGASAEGATVRLLLDELHNGPDPLCAGRELGFNAERFRELEENHEQNEERAGVDAGLAIAGRN
ncbi:MAG: hypothetical protein PHE83_16775 [Opitutaceae bacterium]|nr:hypothetical protein [Opitutaceae bacterium]